MRWFNPTDVENSSKEGRGYTKTGLNSGTCIALKEQVGLSPYEMLYGRPFANVNDLFPDPEAQTFWSYTMAIGQFQQDIHLWSVNQDPKDSKELPVCAPWI